MKIPSSNLERTCCVQKLFPTFRTIFVHNMFSPCSAKRRASDKDLPVQRLWNHRSTSNSTVSWVSLYYYCTVLHFTSERMSPRFLPQNQIKFLSVKKLFLKLFLWLTAFCLAIDNFDTRNWNFSTCCLFSSQIMACIKTLIFLPWSTKHHSIAV